MTILKHLTQCELEATVAQATVVLHERTITLEVPRCADLFSEARCELVRGHSGMHTAKHKGASNAIWCWE